MKSFFSFLSLSLGFCFLGGVSLADHGDSGRLIGDTEVRETFNHAYSSMRSMDQYIDWNLPRIQSNYELYQFKNYTLNNLSHLKNEITNLEYAIQNLNLSPGPSPIDVRIQPWSGKSFIVYRDYKKIYVNVEVVAPGKTPTTVALLFDSIWLRDINDGVSQSPSGSFLFKEDFNDSFSAAKREVQLRVGFSSGELVTLTVPNWYVGPGVIRN